MAKITWHGQTLTVVVDRYRNHDNIAVMLTDEIGDPYATASVNPTYRLPDGLVAIKNWSENEGVESALLEAGLLEKSDCNCIPCGMEIANVYRWLGEAPA